MPRRGCEARNARGAARGAAEERGEPLDVYEAGMLAQVARMLEGDTRAAEFVRDSAGDKPTDKMQAEATVLTAGDVALLRRLGALEGAEEPKKSE